ncbi:MAG TPA: mannose-1-phosphate guanylyltransferase [Cryomorphaceae bacterium]|nr:mannose-1-phosphate guanylyltransferase [Cryomorphaceae bacterium]
MVNKDNYCVIMAGGIGSRFWPMSRTSYPKQFHDILGTGSTLIQQTFERFLHICPKENIYIVTNDLYRELVKEQLDGISYDQILCEPSRRNTAPCVAYANEKIRAKNPNARMIVAPSDHLVLKEQAFYDTIETALEQAQTTGNLVTLGIKPSRPDTGYGYIQFTDAKDAVSAHVKKVKTFTEKPNIDLAREFLKSGDFYWNSGIFIWTLESITDAFRQHLPEVTELFEEGAEDLNSANEEAKIAEIYSVCESVSLDYGIMEKAKNVNVVLSDFGWSDLGTWGSLFTHVKKDNDHNAVVGKNVVLYDSSDNMINVPENKLVVIQGLEDYILVDTEDVLLLCPKEEEQRIKQIVTDLKTGKNANFA